MVGHGKSEVSNDPAHYDPQSLAADLADVYTRCVLNEEGGRGGSLALMCTIGCK